MTTETPTERREREALERCTTERQRARVVQLHADGITCYPATRQGRSVVSSCRRYLETGDAEKIDAGLYHFSTQGAGGLNEIAHFNLHGFRSVYRDPVAYLELVSSQVGREITHSSYVYTDGMTAQEVRAEIFELCERYADEIRERSESSRRSEALALARSLGETYGFTVTED